MANQMAFHIDSSSCVGCRTCEIACKDKQNLTVGPRPRYVREFAGGSWVADEASQNTYRQEGVFSYNVSISCNHCSNPACIAVCPSGAMKKDEETGIVWSDHEVCIGCGSCAQACPYHAPQLDTEDKLVYKCDFCRDLLSANEVPACVETCPMRALDFGEYDELVAKYGSTRDIAPLPSSSETSPNIVITLHTDAKVDTSEGYTTSLYVLDR